MENKNIGIRPTLGSLLPRHIHETLEWTLDLQVPADFGTWYNAKPNLLGPRLGTRLSAPILDRLHTILYTLLIPPWFGINTLLISMPLATTTASYS